MISEKLKSLLTPQVDPSVKLMGVGLFLGKLLDKFDTRVTDLEARQLQKGDKGDQGDSVTVDDVKPLLEKLHKGHLKEQTEDLREIMVKTWRSW